MKKLIIGIMLFSIAISGLLNYSKNTGYVATNDGEIELHNDGKIELHNDKETKL